jgi:hypothetical protein
MKESGEYDVITQSIEIPSDALQNRITGNILKVRSYVLSELARRMAEELIKSGYITETWIKKEYSEECTLTLYVKPLIEKKD